MEANVIELKNRGMHQDFAISKTSDEFAFENINIRITANDDRTLLAVTNEKGSSPIDIDILPITRRFNLVTFKAYYSKGLKWDIIFEHVTTKDVQVRLKRIALPNTKTYVITVPKGTDKYSIPSNIIIDEFESLSNNLKISIEGDRTDINYVYRTQDEINTDPTIGEDLIIAEVGDNKIEGIYLGKAILNNYLVLFCKGEQDYIYRIHKKGDELIGKRLFVGNLNFNLEYPIEAISDYESESVQKVYWVDGLNPNRVINIASSILYTGETSQFDFVPTIEKFPTIEVEKFFGGSGQFKSGVIQYYATYYNKFGSESAIVGVTPLNYISLEDRGGKEDEIINVNFKLTIKNIDKSFQYIRIYSAKRTSVDGPIEASIVGDYQIGDNDEIVLIDTNNNQQNIDPSLFYYISGDLFTATTLEKKDGVLFLGNINITDSDLSSDEKSRVSLYLKSHKITTITREYNKAKVIRINPDESPTRCGNYSGDLAFYIRFDKPVASNVSIRIFYKMIYNTGSSWETAGPLNTIVYIKKGQQQIKIGVLGITEVDDSDYFVTNGSYILMAEGYDTIPYEDKPELYIHRPEDASYGGVTCIGYDNSYIYYTDSDSGAQVSTEETKTEEQMSNDIWECAAITFDYKEVPSEGNTDSYDYKSQLSETSKSIKSFKRGEIYRFAIQFQTSKGNWTNPVWIGDKKCNIAPKHDGGIVSVPTAKFEWTQEAREQLSNILERFVNYRILIAETSESTRSIVAQGMVCPTMFNYGQRTDGTVFSFASYITRPMLSSVHNEHLDGTGANSESNAEIQNLNSGRPPCLEPNGIVVDNNIETADTYIIDFSYRFRSNDFVHFFNGEYCKVFVSIAPAYERGENDYAINYALIEQKYFSGTSYKSARRNLYDTVRAWIYDKTKLELDNDLGITFNEDPLGTFIGFEYWTHVNNKEELKLYDKIDRNPETQLDGNWAWSIINNFEKIYDKGGSQISTQDITKRHGCYIDTSLVTLHSPELYYNKSSILDNTKFRIVGIAPINSIQYDSLIEATTGLSNYAGALSYSGNGKKPLINGYLYSEDVVNWKKDVKKKLQNVLFKMYMWHKQGSIIGQTALLDGQTEYYSVLKHKIFSNFGYSNKTVYNEDISENLGIFNESSAALFDSEENTLLKIKSSFGDIYYCGNYDNLLYAGTDSKYSLDYSKQEGENIALDAYTDPVRIKFKSTPHAIISLGSEDETEVPILSAMNDYHKWSFTKIYGEDFDYLKSPSFDWGVQGISDNTFNKTVLGIYEIYNTSDKTIDYFAQQAINGLSPSILINGAAILSLLNSGIFVCVVTFKEGPNHTAVVDKVIKDFPLLVKATYEAKTITGYTNFLNGRGDIYLSQNRYYLSVPEIRTYVQNVLSFSEEPDVAGYVYIGELFRDIEYNTLYGGVEDFALQSLNWIPVSDGTPIDNNISLMEGDTYYQRFDCLKTYPWTEEDENSVVDVTSFMVETHINLDGRSDINRKGNILNIRPTNFNLRNPVYDQTNNMFVYNILDERFDGDSFKHQIVWSLTKTLTSIIDTWTKLNLANTLSLDNNLGNLTKIIKNNDTLLAFQERGISAINFNNKVQISTEQGVPIELANSGKVDGYSIVTNHYGCLNKFTICKSKSGLYFIDSNKKLLVSISGEGIKEVSTVGGMSVWFKEKINTNVWSPNNTASPITWYDENTNDLYVSNNEWCLVYNEYLQTFTSFMEDYVNVDFGVNLNDKFYYLEHEGTLLNEMFAGDYVKDYSITYRVNAEPYIDKTFTNIEYIADVFDGKTIEPDIIPTNGLMQPFTELKVWNEHQEGTSNLEESKKLSNNIQKKRVWRDFIPRDKNNVRHRIKNPWIFLKLSRTGDTSIKTIFHNLIVKYFK